MKKVGEGQEKNVYQVNQEAWAINKRLQEPGWEKASFLLIEILYAFIPEHLPEPKAYESLMRDHNGESMSRSVLRRSEFITGKIPSRLTPHENDRFEDDRDELLEKLVRLGLSLRTIDEGYLGNYIYRENPHRLVYVDTFEPVVIDYIDHEVNGPGIDSKIIRKRIRNANFSGEKKASLLAKLAEYEKLVASITKAINITAQRDRS